MLSPSSFIVGGSLTKAFNPTFLTFTLAALPRIDKVGAQTYSSRTQR